MAVKIRKPNGYWTYNNCAIETLKYHTKIEFKNTSILKNKWLNNFFKK